MPDPIQYTGLSDLTALAVLLAFSTVAVVLALAAASTFRLDRVASTRLSVGFPRLRAVLTVALGFVALGLLLGLVPGAALLQGWGGLAACAIVLGSLVAAGTGQGPTSSKHVTIGAGSNSAAAKAAA